MRSRVLVVIPTYNEIENIEAVVSRVLAATPGADILIVDDGSPDGTGALANALAASDARVSVLHRSAKDGLGAAYLAGFAMASSRGYEYVVEMDADGSHPPERLPSMLAVVEEDTDGVVGGVIGSRWARGGKVVNWPVSRQLLSRGGSLYARLMLGLRVRDVTAGYRVYPMRVLGELSLHDIESRGYCFQIDMTRRIAAKGLQLVEVPITFSEREHGESKMSKDIVIEAMWRVTVWGLGRLASTIRPRRRDRSPSR